MISAPDSYPIEQGFVFYKSIQHKKVIVFIILLYLQIDTLTKKTYISYISFEK